MGHSGDRINPVRVDGVLKFNRFLPAWPLDRAMFGGTLSISNTCKWLPPPKNAEYLQSMMQMALKSIYV